MAQADSPGSDAGRDQRVSLPDLPYNFAAAPVRDEVKLDSSLRLSAEDRACPHLGKVKKPLFLAALLPQDPFEQRLVAVPGQGQATTL